MLNFEDNWRYYSPGKIPQGVAQEFPEIIGRMARGEQYVLEHFKKYFAAATGTTSSWSSSASWAQSDLNSHMDQAEENAPVYIEAFYDACEDLRKENKYPVPSVEIMNKVLAKQGANYRIEPPNLTVVDPSHIVAPPEVPLSMDERAREIIQTSISEGRTLLSEGKHRQAVQEILWLLETVTTAFQGLNAGESDIKGKYFNKIIDELRKSGEGATLDQVANWIRTLHGYLSAPAGGGIRHGMDLKDGVITTPTEGLLYFNLITSYTTFLLTEYDRLKNSRA